LNSTRREGYPHPERRQTPLLSPFGGFPGCNRAFGDLVPSVAQAVVEPTVTDPPFEVRTSRVGDASIVTIVGEIDMANAPEVRRAIDASRDGAERVVVDLSAVTFLDSSALNALVHSERDLAEREISFRVVGPADQSVRKVFEITHLTEPLSVVDSLDVALAQ
jgi:anti-anti-sigma factor